jgi:hypothetical protein
MIVGHFGRIFRKEKTAFLIVESLPFLKLFQYLFLKLILLNQAVTFNAQKFQFLLSASILCLRLIFFLFLIHYSVLFQFQFLRVLGAGYPHFHFHSEVSFFSAFQYDLHLMQILNTTQNPTLSKIACSENSEEGY